MRIAFDGRGLNRPHLRGMGKATFELLREGLREADLDFVLLGDEPRAPVHRPSHPRVACHTWELKGHRVRAWEQLGLPRRARQLGCDVLHCVNTWCPYWQPLPVVVTVHDTLMWEEEPPSLLLNRVLPAAYRRARAIITASESARADIAGRWPELGDKLVVIPHGIADRYLAPVADRVRPSLAEAGVRPPYLLYLGGEIPRKRAAWAVEVWRALERTDLQLVLCGLGASSVDRLIHPMPADLRRLVISPGFVAEDDMPGLYAQAAAVLYPTLYEGFGFPALESQACGVPVLMSGLGSLKELVGPGAVVLPPHDLRAWVAACRQAIDGGKPSAAAGRAWASQFSWRRTFEKTLEVYRAAVRS